MSLYTTLNIQPNANLLQIRKSYLNLAKKYHPDKCNEIDAKNKFEEINYAYNILINEKIKNEYNKMNNIDKSKFHTYLENIFNDNLKINELKHFGISITEKDFSYISSKLMTFINKFNMFELIKLFTNNIIPKKKNDSVLCSDSDTNLWDEETAEYYKINKLPIIYQKYNKNNICLSLDLSIDDFIYNRLRKIKISRKILSNETVTTFKFYTKYPFIIFNEGGDIDNKNNGNLIIKLNLPSNYSWGDNIIYYNYNISLYQYIYGVNLNSIILKDKIIEIKNCIPHRDGNLMFIDFKTNEYDFVVKFNLIYQNSIENMNILKKYFN